ncbi:MAG: ATP-dependent nuclease [Desertimonas sp.]
MRLRGLKIERFRGIKSLDWTVDGRVCCLVGAGNNCKTTILDAIGLLGTTRTPPFDDFDFHDSDPEAGPIVIEGVFGDLPLSLLADNRFGLDLIGIDEAGVAHDEPGDHAPGIRVRLDVDVSLEPVWRLISSRNPEGRLLSTRDRASLLVGRLGSDPNRQFSLARGTALSRGVANTEDVGAILASAYRLARASVVGAVDLSTFEPAVEEVTATARQVGAGDVADDLSIGLELSPTSAAGLTLHSGTVPVANSGLGTRRLLALGLELGNSESGGLVCIDEIEHGLEPHRIRHLISVLAGLVEPTEGSAGGQLIFTSHSPIVLGELGSAGVAVVRSNAGAVDVREVPDDLTALIRSTPEAVLASRVVVGEGKTEVGLLRAYGRRWAVDHDNQSLAQKGIAVVEGGGHSAPARAAQLASLGYPVVLLADSDTPLTPTPPELTAAGVTVVQWAGGVSTEERLLSDLSWHSVVAAFELVVEQDRERADVVNAILASPPGKAAMQRAGLARNDIGDDLTALLTAGLTEVEARSAFATAAKSKSNGWFKRIDLGEALGGLALEDTDIQGTPFASALADIEGWCHG